MRRKKKTRAKSITSSLGLFQVLLFTLFFYIVNGVTSNPLKTQSVSAQTAGLPFRPLGSESAVDRYSERGRYTETGYREESSFAGAQPHRLTNASTAVRQVSMQSSDFGAPTTGMGTAPANRQATAPFVPPSQTPSAPAAQAPRSLPNSTPRAPSYSAPPIADYDPVAPPQLSNGGYATMADCRLITPPSSYTAMSPYGNACGSVAPTNYASPYVPPPAEIAAPAVMPPVTSLPPVTISPPVAIPPPGTIVSPPSAAPASSLVTFGQERLPVQVGQGLWGQPVAYVPGQRCRNWLRYLSF